MSTATFCGIAHVALVVPDMTTSVHFYEDVLGSERVGEVTEGRRPRATPGAWCVIPEAG